MQKILNYKFSALLKLFLLLVLTPIASANNSVVLLVEQPVVENLPLAIATSQSALQNFIKKKGSQGEIAVISYSTTADVIKPFSQLNPNVATELASDLKKSGARAAVGEINTASGMERAIALLNSDANPDNTKILLVVSDANILTGDKDLDEQFTEWLTEIISEDAVNSAIDVSWHPITKNANHENIDAFLERLNGQRVVLSPEPELIDEAAKPQALSDAELQLELITSQLESSSDNGFSRDEAPVDTEAPPLPIQKEAIEPIVLIEEPIVAVVEPELTPAPETTPALSPPPEVIPEPIAESSLDVEPPEIPAVIEQLPITTIDDESDIASSDTFAEEPANELFSTDNIKIAVLVIIAIAAIFLLRALLSKRRESEVSGTGLADREYKDSRDIAVAASSIAPVTTRANAPIIPDRTPAPAPPPEPATNPMPQKLDDPEPIPTPLSVNDTSDNTSEENTMDGTQEVFPEFASSASLTTAPIEDQAHTAEPEFNEGPLSAKNEKTAAEADSPHKEVDPYATVIAEAPDFTAMTGEETILADDPKAPPPASESTASGVAQSNDNAPPIDPYATVIADASQIKAYAKQFSDGASHELDDDKKTEDDEDDPDKTVLYRPDKNE